MKPSPAFRLIRRFPIRVIGILLLAYVLWVVDLRATVAQLERMSAFSLSAAVFAFVGLVLLRCWRWHLLARFSGAATPVLATFVSCNASIWLGLASPGRVGEFARGVDLARDTGKSLAQTGALVTFDLLLDLAASVVMATAGLILLGFGTDRAGAMLAYLACILAGLAGFLFLGRVIAAARRWLLRSQRLSALLPFVEALAGNLDRKALTSLALVTAGAFLCYTLMIAALIAPMNLPLGATATMTMVALVGVSGAIPITYFGLGTREVTLIWLFGRFGLSGETAVAVSFFFLLAQLLGIAVSLCADLLLRLVVPRRSDDQRG